MARRPGERWPSDARPLRIPRRVLALGLSPRELGLLVRLVDAFGRRPGRALTLSAREAAGLAGCRRSDAALRLLRRLAAHRFPDGAPLLEVTTPRELGGILSSDADLASAIASIADYIVAIAPPKWLKTQGIAPRKHARRSPGAGIEAIAARNSAESLTFAPRNDGAPAGAAGIAPIAAANHAETQGIAPRPQIGTPLALALQSQNQNCNCKRGSRGEDRKPEAAIRNAPERPARLRLPERQRGTHVARDLLAGLRIEGEPRDGYVATPDELRLPTVRERLGVPIEATRTVRTLLARLPWQAIDDALRTVHTARVDGRPIASPAAFFVHLLREAAHAHAIEVPRAGPHRARRSEPSRAILEARA